MKIILSTLLFLFIQLSVISSVSDVMADGSSAKSPWEDSYSAEAFADGAIRDVYCDLVGLVEGTFGGLLFAAAGILAFGFAAFGDSKHGSSAAIVAGAAFTLGAGVSLYFGDLGCGGGGGNAGARQRSKFADIGDPNYGISATNDSWQETDSEEPLF
ncbi:MAG TPA: hypothetical protein PKA63_06925 [Oligoflexia bacterium]|nr:hypothetical protein [Oligoflexia bacterium]HMP48383.1 hypothetical protein [Oligoflexia bacterium]